MAHEHTGECHHHHHEHLHHLAVNLGSLCCTGRCQHPEHQYLGQLAEQQRLFHEQLQAIEQAPVPSAVKNKKESKTKKDKKDKRSQQYGWLALQPLSAI